MATSEPGWELHRTFLEVVRDGSLSGAARRLGLTQPTVGRHIDALETSLGLTLFTRSQRGLMPTPAALELLPHVEAMAAAQQAVQRAASGEAGEERGAVRLTASEIIGCEVLPAMLATFCAQYPGIVPELVANNHLIDLTRRDADIAVRMVRPMQDALIAKRIGTVEIGLYAHTIYANRFGLPTSTSEMATHRLIGFDHDDTSFRSIGVSRFKIERNAFGFRCDNEVAQLAALRAGVGIGGCQRAIAARDAGLIAVLPAEIAFSLEMWLVMHESLRTSRRVRLLFDHLAKGLGAFVNPSLSPPLPLDRDPAPL